MEDIDLKAEIAAKIKKIRGKMKQKDFAALIEIHKDQLSRYERAKALPRPETLKKIFQFDRNRTDLTYDASHLREGLVTDYETAYEVHRVEGEELINNVKKILESKNENVIKALKTNIVVFLEALKVKDSD